VTETIAAIVAAHRAGSISPAQTVARSFARIRNRNDPAIFISLRDEKEAVDEAERLMSKALQLHRQGRLAQAEPLYREVLASSPGHAEALHISAH